MTETLEIRINYEFAHLLFKANEGKDLGQLSKSIKIIELSKDDPRYKQIPIISKLVKEKYDKSFYFGWQIKRKYSKIELDNAVLLQMKIKTTFEPSGEECGTLYDEAAACEICGANRVQISTLILKKGSIPRKDIARTIAGEVVVSQKFETAFRQMNFKGITFRPTVFSNEASDYYQLHASTEIDLSFNTISGVDPFDFSESSGGIEFTVPGGYPIKFGKEVYKCPKGHTIGLNLLSEVHIVDTPSIYLNDFMSTNQKIGVKRGLLRPETIYLCSQAFRKMVIEEKLSGFDFEIAHVE